MLNDTQRKQIAAAMKNAVMNEDVEAGEYISSSRGATGSNSGNLRGMVRVTDAEEPYEEEEEDEEEPYEEEEYAEVDEVFSNETHERDEDEYALACRVAEMTMDRLAKLKSGGNSTHAEENSKNQTSRGAAVFGDELMQDLDRGALLAECKRLFTTAPGVVNGDHA
jgi:hypothetical protein